MTQSNRMSISNGVMPVLLSALFVGLSWPQNIEQDFHVYTEHPRLLLTARRLRLLRRERERQSIRWRQFEALVAGGARMPEQGFALALFSQTSADPSYCKQAFQWALGPTTDVRQTAIAYDWCQPALTEAQSRSLETKLKRGIDRNMGPSEIPAMRDRIFAAIALADAMPDVSEQQLRAAVQKWWLGEIAPALKSGRDVVPPGDTYALFEILHVIRDNLKIDLRENAPSYFKELPVSHLLSYYPAPYPAAENEYRIPANNGGDPNLKLAALSRAGELAMVAYDPNSEENLFLQGWLVHDLFLMRSPFGITYEFLWANPYLPGLSYYHMPLYYHDKVFGKLFLRSSWEDDAIWLGYFNGEMQVFQNEKLKVIKQPPAAREPVRINDALVLFSQRPFRFNIDEPDIKTVFVVGLRPNQRYEIEVDDEEMREQKTDSGGILVLTMAPRINAGVRIREVKQTQ